MVFFNLFDIVDQQYKVIIERKRDHANDKIDSNCGEKKK
jgi:hypothetical protein